MIIFYFYREDFIWASRPEISLILYWLLYLWHSYGLLHRLLFNFGVWYHCSLGRLDGTSNFIFLLSLLLDDLEESSVLFKILSEELSIVLSLTLIGYICFFIRRIRILQIYICFISVCGNFLLCMFSDVLTKDFTRSKLIFIIFLGLKSILSLCVGLTFFLQAVHWFVAFPHVHTPCWSSQVLRFL